MGSYKQPDSLVNLLAQHRQIQESDMADETERDDSKGQDSAVLRAMLAERTEERDAAIEELQQVKEKLRWQNARLDDLMVALRGVIDTAKRCRVQQI